MWFRNWRFYIDEFTSKKDALLSLSNSLLSFINYFEFAANIEFDLLEEIVLFNDKSNNIFKFITLIDIMFVFEMGAQLILLQKYYTFIIIQLTCIENCIDKIFEINGIWDIIMLNKKNLFYNNDYKSYPNFDYERNKHAQNLGKINKLESKQIVSFRNLFIQELKNNMNTTKGITKFILNRKK